MSDRAPDGADDRCLCHIQPPRKEEVFEGGDVWIHLVCPRHDRETEGDGTDDQQRNADGQADAPVVLCQVGREDQPKQYADETDQSCGLRVEAVDLLELCELALPRNLRDCGRAYELVFACHTKSLADSADGVATARAA